MLFLTLAKSKEEEEKYWPEQRTASWETTAQLGTHIPDLQQISDNLTREEEEEKQEQQRWAFSGGGKKHRIPEM